MREIYKDIEGYQDVEIHELRWVPTRAGRGVLRGAELLRWGDSG